MSKELKGIWAKIGCSLWTSEWDCIRKPHSFFDQGEVEGIIISEFHMYLAKERVLKKSHEKNNR